MKNPLSNVLRHYRYDPLDRMTGVGPIEQTNTKRFYLHDDLVTELDDVMQRTILRQGEMPLALRQTMEDETETVFLATDQANSVLQSLAGASRQRLGYTAYGHRPDETSCSGLLGFNGENPDTITGHYFLGLGERAFNPVLMRFNSPDSLSPFGGGGINSYAYCGGDPINFQDPTGNIRIPLTARPSVIVKNPLYRIKPTATAIQKANPVKQNPMLNSMLDANAGTPQAGPSRIATASNSPSLFDHSILRRLPAEGWTIYRKSRDTPRTAHQTSSLKNMTKRADAAREYDDLVLQGKLDGLPENPTYRNMYETSKMLYEEARASAASATKQSSYYQFHRRKFKNDIIKKYHEKIRKVETS